MFSNFIKKLADKDYLLFSECFFDFTSGGEQNCNIKIVNYDINGNFQKTEDVDNLTNDYHFFLYGSYMIIWLAQIFDTRVGAMRDNSDYWGKIGPIFNALFEIERYGIYSSSGEIIGFDSRIKEYDFNHILSLFSKQTKITIIENHSSVQFKIHKIYKKPIVRVHNLPISQDVEGQLYLFVVLFDNLCKKYHNANKILSFGCSLLETCHPHRPAVYIANKTIETILENIEKIGTLKLRDLESEVSNNIMSDPYKNADGNYFK